MFIGKGNVPTMIILHHIISIIYLQQPPKKDRKTSLPYFGRILLTSIFCGGALVLCLSRSLYIYIHREREDNMYVYVYI